MAPVGSGRGAGQDDAKPDITVHATCVALGDGALLITGASGRGKSSLALHLMALGAALVADDRVRLSRDADRIVASAPPAIRGLIEARGLGLLNAADHGPARLIAVVDLDREETDRLPIARTIVLLGVSLPLIRKIGAAHFPAALIQYLRAGRREP